MATEEKRSLKFLIVDDDVPLSLSLKKTLMEDGHTAFTETTVRQSLKFITEQEVDILLVDLVLPDGDGSEIIKVVKEHHKSSYCVLISGYYDKSFDNYTILVGANQVIGKPITKEVLDDVIHQYRLIHTDH